MSKKTKAETFVSVFRQQYPSVYGKTRDPGLTHETGSLELRTGGEARREYYTNGVEITAALSMQAITKRADRLSAPHLYANTVDISLG
ncbi:MAG TPA: hypothetical protein VGW38_04785 [Chloroflexota bacterium]|nr:hypothetical protein [Chloroflexota bacterium]